MLKIQRFDEGEFAVFALSGRIQAVDLPHLEALLAAEQRKIVLDLNEVDLVSREVVKFIAGREEDGARLKDCPAYIREWISRERCAN
jgi:hypothetical protein